MKNNCIKISKEGNEKIIFIWNNGNKKIEIFIKEERDYEKNSFDNLFDFIIECIENKENIEFEFDENIKKDDSRINNIAIGIVEICKKEINEIKKEIEGDQ